jgi:hypothetical protein
LDGLHDPVLLFEFNALFYAHIDSIGLIGFSFKAFHEKPSPTCRTTVMCRKNKAASIQETETAAEKEISIGNGRHPDVIGSR